MSYYNALEVTGSRKTDFTFSWEGNPENIPAQVLFLTADLSEQQGWVSACSSLSSDRDIIGDSLMSTPCKTPIRHFHMQTVISINFPFCKQF